MIVGTPVTRAICKKIAERTDTVVFGFSRGKDSVHAESLLLVRWRGRIERISIGELIQKVRSTIIAFNDGRRHYIPTESLEVCTTTTNHQSSAACSFFPVTKLMDHPHEDDLYEFTLREGRVVRMTGCHSAMASPAHHCGNAMQPVEARSLHVGDHMLAVNDYGSDANDDAQYEDWFLRLAGQWLADGCYAVNRKIVISTGNMPEAVDFLRMIPRSTCSKERAGVYLKSIRDNYDTQEAAVKATAAALGIKECVVLNSIYQIKNARTHKYIKAKVLPNGDVWMCDIRLVARMRAAGLAGTSHTKTVPNWIYSLSRRQIGIFLAGYFDGDGCLHKRGVSATSVSRSLAYGIADACNMIGVKCAVSTGFSKSGYQKQASSFYCVNIGSRQGIEAFRERIPTWKNFPFGPRKPQNVYATGIRKIKSIRRIPSGGRVYDLEVEGRNTFIADGVLVHNSIAAWLWMLEFFPRIIPFCVDGCPGLEFVERSLAYYEKAFGTPIERCVSQTLLAAIADLVYQPFEDEEWIDKMDFTVGMSNDELAETIRDKHDVGHAWIAWGISAADSIVRRSQQKYRDGMVESKRVFYPCTDWKRENVLQAINASEFKLPEDYLFANRSFVSPLNPRHLKRLREQRPDEFERIKFFYPLIEASLARNEFRTMPSGTSAK